MKKYELLEDDTIILDSRKLYRIRYLRDFANIKKGDLGGYIESEKNLSHEGDARVLDNAKVYHQTSVSGNAKIFGDASVYGDARIYGNAKVCDDAKVYGNAMAYGNAIVCGDDKLY